MEFLTEQVQNIGDNAYTYLYPLVLEGYSMLYFLTQPLYNLSNFEKKYILRNTCEYYTTK